MLARIGRGRPLTGCALTAATRQHIGAGEQQSDIRKPLDSFMNLAPERPITAPASFSC